MNLASSSRLQKKKFHTKTSHLSSEITSCGTSTSHTPIQSQLISLSSNNLHLPPISNIKTHLPKCNPPISQRNSSFSSDFSDTDENISNELISLNYFTGEAIKFLRNQANEYAKIKEKTLSNLEKSLDLQVDLKNCESVLLKDRFLQARKLEKAKKTPEFRCFPLGYEEKNTEAYCENKEKQMRKHLRAVKHRKTKERLRTLAENPISFTNIPMPQRKIFR
ncbi:hypothetical protein SteCoe_37351 [Stentor coeruleus]|uniref:Uncharacterized protein n=1 Tax=Stentor coeruleus TaxID=5963 RepID=A0A1R2AN69_9CILI|nr:hypothetical protein SteCoe_37351 [Stentor coeruleus]